MEDVKSQKNKKLYRLTLFIIFFIFGLSICLFGLNSISTFPTNNSTIYKIIIAALFLMLTVISYLTRPLKKYWRVSFAFFIASLGMLLDWVMGDLPVRFLYDYVTIAEGQLMLEKFSTLIAIVIPILVLTLAFRDKLSSLYIQRGRSRLWIIIGLSTFIILVIAGLLLSLQKNNLERILTIFPWLFGFSLFIGIMEELYFRGLFLKKFEPFLGIHLSIFLTSLMFSIPHIFVRYISGIEMSLILFVITFLLGMALGYIIYKTKSIWGAIIIHIGCDLFYALAFGFASVE